MKTIHTNYLRLFTLLILSPLFGQAATFYWVGGSGNWSDFSNHWATSSGGTTFHSSIPTLNDDVVIDNASFTAGSQTLLLDSTFYFCKSITCTNAQFSPTITGNSATLYIYGSMQLDASINMESTYLVFRGSGSGNVLSTGNQILETVTIDSPGQYSLGSDINMYMDLTIQNGASFDANNYDITCRSFTSDLGTTVTTGDININLDGRWNDSYTTRKIEWKGTVNNTTLTNLFFHCNIGAVYGLPNIFQVDSMVFTNTGSVQNVLATYLYLPGSCNVVSSTIHHAEFGETDCYLTSCTFDTLLGKSFVFNGDSTRVTVNNYFGITSNCNDLGSITSFNSPSGFGQLIVPSGTVNIDWVSMANIHAGGGAVFNANNIIDGGNNTGWNLNALTPRTMYWIGGSGNWDDGAHWSLSSGGGSAGCKPTQLDNVIFDNNSFTGDDTINTNQYEYLIGSVTFTGITTSPRFVGNILKVYGSFNLDPSVRMDLLTLRLMGTQSGLTLKTGGNALQNVDMTSVGTYDLLDSLKANLFYLESGGLNLNGHYLDADVVNTYSGTTLDASNAVIYSQELTLSGTVTGSTSTMIFMNRYNSVIIEPGNFYSVAFTHHGTIMSPLTLHYLNSFDTLDINAVCTIGQAQFHGTTNLHTDNTFDSLVVMNGGYVVTLDSGTTQTILSAIISYADCNNLVSIRSSKSGEQVTISKATGSVSADYLQLSDILATGGATFTANNSIDAGNNSGWTINSASPRTLYWIGGSGNWNDQTNWSLSSGGAGGECTPTAIDDVVFDNASAISGGTVTVNIMNASVHSLDMQNAGSNVSMEGNNLSVYGNLALAPAMIWNINNLNLIPGSAGITLSSNGTELQFVTINGTGNIVQNDALYATSLNMINGNFDANGFDVSASVLQSAPGTIFTSGAITITVADFALQGTINNSSSTDVICQQFPAAHSVNSIYLFRSSGTFRDITVMNDGLSFLLADVNCRVLTAYGDMAYGGYLTANNIQKLIAFGNLTLQNNNVDTLYLNNPGKTVNMAYTVTIGSELIANGTPAFPVFIQGGAFMNLVKTGGQVCLSDVLLSNVPCSGGAQFFAGQGCVDLGGNTGWQFAPCTVSSDVWPGDANYDLVCDNLDILNIGVAFAESGPTRAGASNSWTAQPANDFGNWFSSAVNMKHADCDGNGTVDYNDTLAVNQNYSLNHPARLANIPNHINSSLPPLVLVASPDTVAPSSTVFVDVQLGSQTLPVDSLYGIAFSVFYDPAMLNASTVHADFTGSWLGTVGTDMIGFARNNAVEGRIDFALCRTDHQNIYGGFGHLALFDVVVVDNISTISEALFSVSNISAITYTQFNLAIGRLNDTITIDPLLGIHKPLNLASNFFIFPNPARDKVSILAHDVQLKSVELYDMQGRIVGSAASIANDVTLNTASLASGIYEIRCITDNGEYHSRLEIAGK